VGDQAAAIRALVDAGADVNAINAMGDSTALMLAAQAENPVVIRALVESGALVDLAADDVTPLMVAAKTGCFETTRLLLELGADPRICAGRFAAADYARSRGHEELAELLEVACSQRGG
jgi:ankyrin repeat protein